MGFQVPRVTIKIDFKEGASFGELSLISFGYGLHQAWIYSSMFDKGGIFGTGGLQAGPFNDQLSLAYFVSILIYGLLLLIASILDTKLIRALHATPTLVAAALLGATGTLLLLGSGAESPFDGSTLQIISGILTGTGSSILLLAWGIAFSRRDSASIIINGALSIAIGFGIYGLVLHQIPFPWGGAASALIPFAEIALLLVAELFGGGADRRAVDDHRGAGDRIPGAVFHDALHDGIGRSAGRGVPLRGDGHDGDHLALDAAHDVLSGEHLPDDRADLLVFDIEGDLLVHIGILRLDDERVAVILLQAFDRRLDGRIADRQAHLLGRGRGGLEQEAQKCGKRDQTFDGR